jgi:hypothetical protein
MDERDLAVTLARGRIAFGVVSLLAPGLLAQTMTGRGRSEGGTRLFVRMIGARDLGVGIGLEAAVKRRPDARLARGISRDRRHRCGRMSARPPSPALRRLRRHPRRSDYWNAVERLASTATRTWKPRRAFEIIDGLTADLVTG